MKQLTIFCALALLISCFSSCSKEDIKTPEELIVGKWQLEKIYDLAANDASDECTPQNKMTFFSDHTMKWFSYSLNSGNCEEFVYHFNYNVTYQIEGSALTIHLESPDESSESEIEYPAFTVSETELIIKLTNAHKGAVYKRIP